MGILTLRAISPIGMVVNPVCLAIRFIVVKIWYWCMVRSLLCLDGVVVVVVVVVVLFKIGVIRKNKSPCSLS